MTTDAAELIVAETMADLPDSWPTPGDPMAVARRLLEHYTTTEVLTLRAWRDGWLQHRGTHWVDVETAIIRASIYDRLEKAQYWKITKDATVLEPWRPTRAKVANVVEATAALTQLSTEVEPPVWLDDDPNNVPANRIVACANGLLDIKTRILHPLTARFFNRVATPFSYLPNPPKPTAWLTFLHQIWPADPDAIAALQQFAGYLVSGRRDMQKILLLVGPKRSGKGSIAAVLSQLVGAGNTAAPSLSSLGTNFGLEPLINKSLAVIGDMRLGRANVEQIVGQLLTISGEDMITVDRKHRQAWTGHLPTRFVILSNELPMFGDASGAIATRFVALTTETSFLGREDHELAGKLVKELPGILSWALAGLDRLNEQDHFTEPESSRDSMEALEDLVSPTTAFLRECCELGGEAPADEIWARWQSWAIENGHNTRSNGILGQHLRAAIPGLRRAQRGTGSARVRVYVGLRLLPAPPPTPWGGGTGGAGPVSANVDFRDRGTPDDTGVQTLSDVAEGNRPGTGRNSALNSADSDGMPVSSGVPTSDQAKHPSAAGAPTGVPGAPAAPPADNARCSTSGCANPIDPVLPHFCMCAQCLAAAGLPPSTPEPAP